jgi:hypothetical protein
MLHHAAKELAGSEIPEPNFGFGHSENALPVWTELGVSNCAVVLQQ